ncbi:MAG: hypothetical protein ABIP94_06155 [Planctomycetota bacterium]
MAARNTQRLRKVEHVVATLPIRKEVLVQAYTNFREAGQLPKEQRVSADVVRCVKNGHDPRKQPLCYSDIPGLVVAHLHAPERPKDEVLDLLLDEAVWAPEPLRSLARDLLEEFVDMGADVTKPFLAERGIQVPDFGSAALHLIGFPHRFGMPPYEEQAERLFARYAELRERIDQNNTRWFDEAQQAIELFQMCGDLPRDELLRDAVLADAELCTLVRHARGKDVSELMAAFDAAANAKADERDAAIAQVQALVRSAK